VEMGALVRVPDLGRMTKSILRLRDKCISLRHGENLSTDLGLSAMPATLHGQKSTRWQWQGPQPTRTLLSAEADSTR
jgi:hypothetical protein